MLKARGGVRIKAPAAPVAAAAEEDLGDGSENDEEYAERVRQLEPHAAMGIDADRHALVRASLDAVRTWAHGIMAGAPYTSHTPPNTIRGLARTLVHEDASAECAKNMLVQRLVRVWEPAHVILRLDPAGPAGNALTQTLMACAHRPPWPTHPAATTLLTWAEAVQLVSTSVEAQVAGLVVLDAGMGRVGMLVSWLTDAAACGFLVLWHVTPAAMAALIPPSPGETGVMTQMFASQPTLKEEAQRVKGCTYVGYTLVDHALCMAASVAHGH
jgi:hypothetical protein